MTQNKTITRLAVGGPLDGVRLSTLQTTETVYVPMYGFEKRGVYVSCGRYLLWEGVR